MPVQLPLQPAGINLPAQPQNPPTFADVLAAKSYHDKVESAAGNFIRCGLHTAMQALNGPTADDSARADIYKTDIIMAHSAAGMLLGIIHD